MSTGEAVHPSMGTSLGMGWGSKNQLSMSCIVGEDPGGPFDSHTLTCETWYSLLQVTSPTLGGLASTDSQYLSSIQC